MLNTIDVLLSASHYFLYVPINHLNNFYITTFKCNVLFLKMLNIIQTILLMTYISGYSIKDFCSATVIVPSYIDNDLDDFNWNTCRKCSSVKLPFPKVYESWYTWKTSKCGIVISLFVKKSPIAICIYANFFFSIFLSSFSKLWMWKTENWLFIGQNDWQ